MNNQIDFNGYEERASQMTDDQIRGELSDILRTLKNSDALDRETGSDNGGRYRDQASVLRRELKQRGVADWQTAGTSKEDRERSMFGGVTGDEVREAAKRVQLLDTPADALMVVMSGMSDIQEVSQDEEVRVRLNRLKLLLSDVMDDLRREER